MKPTTITAAILAVFAAWGFSRAQHWKGVSLQYAHQLKQKEAVASSPAPAAPIYLGNASPSAPETEQPELAEPKTPVHPADDAATVGNELALQLQSLEEEKQALLNEVLAYRQEKETAEAKAAEEEAERAQRNEERQARRQERSSRFSQNLTGQRELFASIDTSYFSPEQKETFSEILDILDLLNEKTAAAAADPDSADDIRREMHEIFPVLREKLMAGRETLVTDMLVNDLGFSPSEAGEIGKDLEFLNDMTSIRSLMRGLWSRGNTASPSPGGAAKRP